MRKEYLKFLKSFWQLNETLSIVKHEVGTKGIYSAIEKTTRRQIVRLISASLNRLLCQKQTIIDDLSLIPYERKPINNSSIYIIYITKLIS